MTKKRTKTKAFHTDSKEQGMGDFYGIGVRNPIGKMRSDSPGYSPISKSKLKRPPKSLA